MIIILKKKHVFMNKNEMVCSKRTKMVKETVGETGNTDRKPSSFGRFSAAAIRHSGGGFGRPAPKFYLVAPSMVAKQREIKRLFFQKTTATTTTTTKGERERNGMITNEHTRYTNMFDEYVGNFPPQ